jgi:hypothetical protein
VPVNRWTREYKLTAIRDGGYALVDQLQPIGNEKS